MSAVVEEQLPPGKAPHVKPFSENSESQRTFLLASNSKHELFPLAFISFTTCLQHLLGFFCKLPVNTVSLISMN
ncbi:hypothetical protein T4E_2140 [Trichinella pseudospiralis]|uniref:Uncharacterized protein n=1 Tax=Trichinella pseudospiralis TaxID=6337 RepID=A0A0V0XGN1_TRIPS|nr:hypothetical protein T4E_2140 [Trichinella pseudospiralis]